MQYDMQYDLYIHLTFRQALNRGYCDVYGGHGTVEMPSGPFICKSPLGHSNAVSCKYSADLSSQGNAFQCNILPIFAREVVAMPQRSLMYPGGTSCTRISSRWRLMDATPESVSIPPGNSIQCSINTWPRCYAPEVPHVSRRYIVH